MPWGGCHHWHTFPVPFWPLIDNTAAVIQLLPSVFAVAIIFPSVRIAGLWGGGWVANCQANCLGCASKEIDVALEDGLFQVVLKLSLSNG